MSTLATQPTDLPLAPFIEGLTPRYRQKEATTLVDLFEKLTGEKAVVWGEYFIIGFGQYCYSRKKKLGLRLKNKVTLYLTTDLDQYEELLNELDRCLYLKKLADVHLDALEKLIIKAYQSYDFWHRPLDRIVPVGNMIFTSGQIAMDPHTGELELDSIEVETERVMRNLQAVLLAAGSDFNNVVKTSIFLSSMDHFPKVNEIYARHFSPPYPARETVAVKTLPKNVNVEISCIAVRKS